MPAVVSHLSRSVEPVDANAVLDDTELLTALTDGDSGAASALHDRTRNVVERTVRRLLGPNDFDKEDLCQLAFIELVNTIQRFRGECPLDAWVSVVSARVVYKRLRRRKLERKIFSRTSLQVSAGPVQRFFLAQGALTRVSVDEGVVEVRRAAASTYVHPGENWPEHCAANLSAAIVTPQGGSPAEQVPKRVASASGAASKRASMTPHSLAPAVSSSVEVSTVARHSDKEISSVAQQNELFSKAVAATRLGDTRGALSSFELFVARYPTSPLAESAAVHRLRLLRRIDPVAAQTAARAYLSRYPGGYAKNDSEKLLSQP